MYLPEHFKNEDFGEIVEFCQCYSFATIISGGVDELIVNHLPLLIDSTRGPKGVLIGHMARGNPQWKSWTPGCQVVCVFNGPHGYISPKWYRNPLNVPTWNYAVVHLKGAPRLVEDHQGIESILKALVDKHETQQGTNWSYDLPEEYRKKLTRAIVGFEIDIAHVEAKFKLSQNRADADRLGAIEGLSASPDPASQDLAQLMKRHWPEWKGFRD